MRKFPLVAIFAMAACTALWQGKSAQAAPNDYPSAPIRLIIPYSPGGGTDIIGRLLGSKLSTLLKQTVVAENRPGASGMIGASAVAHAKPDGLTILLASSGEVAITPHLYKDMNYDPATDLAPISLIAKIPNLLVANLDIPANNVAELVEYARHNKLTFASSGAGNIQGLTGELFNIMAGVSILQIPYKGAPPAIADVVAKRVSTTFQPVSTLLPFIQNKQIKVLATTSTFKIDALPDVPPIAKTPGLEKFDMVNWYGLFAPAHTPPAIVKQLNTALTTVLKDAEVIQTLERLGAIASPTTPEEFSAFRTSESQKFAKIIKDSGLVLGK